MQHWLVKSALVLAFLGVGYVLVRPPRTDATLAIRRMGTLLVLATAVFAVLFPGLFNQFAVSVGVVSGTNLLVYLLVVVTLGQIASNYRRDVTTRLKLTRLARELALLQNEVEQGKTEFGQARSSESNDSGKQPDESAGEP